MIEYQSRRAAWRAMVLLTIIPGRGQADGTVRLGLDTYRLTRKGRIVKLFTRPLIAEYRIPNSADLFEQVGNKWNARNPQHDRYDDRRGFLRKHDLKFIAIEDKPRLEGYDTWGPSDWQRPSAPVEKPALVDDSARKQTARRMALVAMFVRR